MVEELGVSVESNVRSAPSETGSVQLRAAAESEVARLDPLRDEGWDGFVQQHTLGTVFHTSAWLAVLQEAYGYSPTAYVLLDGAGRIEAGLVVCLVRSRLTVTRLVSLPFCDQAPPLTDTPEQLGRLTRAAIDEVRGGAASRLEIRGGAFGSTAETLGLQPHVAYYNYTIPLRQGIAQLEESLHPSTKRAIRKARREGVTVRLGESWDDVAKFYELNVWTRKKHGVIPQPRRFFEALYRNLLSQGKGFLLLAETAGRVVAGDLILASNATAFYKFNASDERYLHLRPNNLLLWTAVELCHDQGYEFFDLGRCSIESDGLRRFKQQWGSREAELADYHYPSPSGVNTVGEQGAKYRLMQMLVRSAPQRMLEAAGGLLYRHLG